MAFRTSNVRICGSQVNVTIQSNLFRFCAHLTFFVPMFEKKKPSFYFLSKVGSVEPKISSDFRWTLQWRLVKNPMGNPQQSLRALIRSANYLLWTVVSLSLRFDMYMFASWKQDFDYISHKLFQVNLNEATVFYLLRRRPKACLLKHLFSPPWTTFSTETSLVFSRRRPQTRPGCLRSLRYIIQNYGSHRQNFTIIYQR